MSQLRLLANAHVMAISLRAWEEIQEATHFIVRSNFVHDFRVICVVVPFAFCFSTESVIAGGSGGSQKMWARQDDTMHRLAFELSGEVV